MELLQAFEGEQTNERILKIILDEDELSWQQIIYDLVRSEQMDPWDINVTTITQKFLGTIRKLTELDFRVSGKMVLASALLLKIKSNQLMDEDFQALDQLIAQTEDPMYVEDDFFAFDHELFEEPAEPEEQPKIYPRTPQPRQRKVSVYDLVDALEQALDVRVKREKRALDRVETQLAEEVKVPEKQIDVSSMMNTLLEQISGHFRENDELHFDHLAPSDDKQDKVLTFIPLLHLTNERRIDLEQERSFAQIYISLLDDTPVEYSEEVEEVVVA